MQIASLDVCLPRLVLLLASHVCQMLAAGHAETQDQYPQAGSWILLLIPIFLGDLRALTRPACRVMSIPNSRVSQLVSNGHVS